MNPVNFALHYADDSRLARLLLLLLALPLLLLALALGLVDFFTVGNQQRQGGRMNDE